MKIRQPKARLYKEVARLLRAFGPLRGRPALGLPELRRAMVIAPHPDDEALGCGGTIALLADKKCETTVAFVGDGRRMPVVAASGDEIAAARRGEAEESCRILGAAPHFMGYPNGLAKDVPRLAADFEQLTEKYQPEVVFIPWFLDQHPDHRAVNSALALTAGTRSVQIWGYEVWTPLAPTRVVDIAEAIERKTKAIAAHRTDPALRSNRFVLALNEYRSSQSFIRAGHAEAFLALPSSNYFELVRESASA